MQKNTEGGPAERPQGVPDMNGNGGKSGPQGNEQQDAPMYAPPELKDYFIRSNPQGVAMLGFGLAFCSFFLGAFVPLAGLICAVLGFVLCVVGRRSTRHGTAIGGMMVSAFGLAVSLLNLLMFHHF